MFLEGNGNIANGSKCEYTWIFKILYILDKKIKLQIEKRASIHINGVIARNYLLGR